MSFLMRYSSDFRPGVQPVCRASEQTGDEDLPAQIEKMASQSVVEDETSIPQHQESHFHDASENPEAEDELYAQSKTGWGELADLIAKHPDFAAFEHFGDLQAKSLLYYQADLCRLRKKLNSCERRDKVDGDKRRSMYNKHIDWLLDCKDLAYNFTSAQLEQWKTIEEIREVLEKYNAAMLAYSQLLSMPQPDRSNVTFLREWLKDDIERKGISRIQGSGSGCWGGALELAEVKDEMTNATLKQFRSILRHFLWPREEPKNIRHLVLLRPRPASDGMTEWTVNELVPFFHGCRLRFSGFMKDSEANPDISTENGNSCGAQQYSNTRSSMARLSRRVLRRVLYVPPFAWITTRMILKEGSEGLKVGADPGSQSATSNKDDNVSKTASPMERYRSSRVLHTTSFIAIITACLLPTLAIAILAQITQLGEMIGIIGLLTALFAAGLVTLSNPETTRVEIFTATAAFSAVLVVFVQTPLQTAATNAGQH